MSPEEQKANRLKINEKQIAQSEAKLAELKAKRDKLAPPTPAAAGSPAPAKPAAPEVAATDTQANAAAKDILNAQTIDVWTSDLRVAPGKTYRYRVRVGVVNPLFGKDNITSKDQLALKDQFLLFSPWTDWTTPVAVEPMIRFTFGQPSRAPAPGQAPVKIARYFDGSWREKDFRLKPGDPIGEGESVQIPTESGPVSANLDYSTGAVLVDIDFNYLVPTAGGRADYKTRVIYVQDGQMVWVRTDKATQAVGSAGQ
jgi:hypothetical protein